jgi:hypothetical protein
MDYYDDEIRALLHEEEPTKAAPPDVSRRASILLFRAILVTAFLMAFACGAYELFVAR